MAQAIYSSSGTRSVFGRRYPTDPALDLEYQRLSNEYALAPGRENLAFSREQLANQMALEDKKTSQQAFSGVTSAGLNAATLRAITMEKGAPFFGETATNAVKGTGDKIASLWNGTPATTAAADGTVPAAASGAVIGGSAVNTMNAAQIEALNSGAGYEAIAAAGESGVTSTGAAASTVGGTASTVALPAAAAGYVGGKLGQPVGEAIGLGGKSERSAAGGAAAGALAGAYATSWSGPGAIVGAVIGGVVGFATKDSWVCTAIDTLFKLPPETIKALSDLRRYSIKYHKAEAKKYYKNGHRLVTAINGAKKPKRIYEYLRGSLVDDTARLVSNGDMELAYINYVDIIEGLCDVYEVDLSIKEGK